jgi:hypothetical protein
MTQKRGVSYLPECEKDERLDAKELWEGADGVELAVEIGVQHYQAVQSPQLYVGEGAGILVEI